MPSSGIKHMYKQWITGVATRDCDNTGTTVYYTTVSFPGLPHLYSPVSKWGGLEMRLGALSTCSHSPHNVLPSPGFINGNSDHQSQSVTMDINLSKSV